METTLLWLLLIEALILPHILWLLSKRYRHATVYTWRVHVLRNRNEKEEDPTACTLQAYRLGLKERASKPFRNGVNSRQANGDARGSNIQESNLGVSPDIQDQGASSRSNGHDRGQSQGRTNLPRGQNSNVMTTDLDDGMTALTQLTTSNIVVLHENGRQSQDENAGEFSSTQDTSSKPRGILKDSSAPKKAPRVLISESVANDSFSSSSTPTSPSKSSLGTPSRGPSEVKRSASASSRQEWKERMRKKHLPAIFINRSLEDDAQDKEMTELSPEQQEVDTASEFIKESDVSGNVGDADVIRRNIAISQTQGNRNTTSIDSTYYMSSDYHYDCLNETLHPPLKQQGTLESEGVSGMYEADDIDNILDNSIVSEHAHVDTLARRKSNGGISQTSRDDHHLVMNSANYDRVTDFGVSAVSRTRPDISNVQQDGAAVSNVYGEEFSENVHRGPAILGVYYDDPHPNAAPTVTSGTVSAQERDSTDTAANGGSLDHGGRPYISRGNYRKYLAYTDLVVSSVDVVEEKDNAKTINDTDNTNEPNGHSESMSESTGHSETFLASNAASDFKASKIQSPTSLSDSVDKESAAHKEDKNVKADTKFSENVLQDYNQLETVSGSEMLHLKMKSLRSALALEYSDDTTSDEGGIDNKGFDDTFDDDNDEDDDSSKGYGNSIPHKAHNNPAFRREQSFNNVKQGKTSAEDDSILKIHAIPERDGNGDGEEAEPIAAQNAVVVRNNVNHENASDQPGSPVNASVSNNKSNNATQESRKASYENNPFLRESFESLSQSPEYKNRFQSKKNPFFNSTDSSTGSVFGTSWDISETDFSANQKTYPESRTSLSQQLSTDISSSVRADSSPTKVAKPPVPIMKPPRLRKETQEKNVGRHTSSEDELNTIFRGNTNEKDLVKQNSPNDFMGSSGSHLNENNTHSDIVETESNASDQSVVIEPYGQRRPPWMDESLDSSASSGHIVFRDNVNSESETDTLTNDNPSTDSHFPISQEIPNSVEEYDFDSINIGDLNSNLHPNSPIRYQRPNTSQQPLVQYHFDEDIERGFEDALAVDYIVHSNVYSGMGLCFESIREEPEDSLSESASSFGVGENSSSNIFKTQAVVSRPSSRASNTGPSPLEIAPSPFEDTHQPDNVVKDLYFNSNDILSAKVGQPFPATERTSADGSESISVAHNGNGVGTPQKSVADPWGININPRISSSHSQPHVSPPTFIKQDIDFETPDDLRTALAPGYEEADDEVYKTSPWLGAEQNVGEPTLDMSFDSDFSQQSSDNTLENIPEDALKAGRSSSPAKVKQGTGITPVYF